MRFERIAPVSCFFLKSPVSRLSCFICSISTIFLSRSQNLTKLDACVVLGYHPLISSLFLLQAKEVPETSKFSRINTVCIF